jgi:PHD/YefM family antitoxin component YafN of YafNO toxin-antitoxin module
VIEAVVVSPVFEARQKLSQTLARFRVQGAEAAPVVLGSQRAPEAVLVSYERYKKMELQLEKARAWMVRARADAVALASVRAEGLEPDEFGHKMAQRVVDGEITNEEAIAELDQHFGHPRSVSLSLG